ncbi:hypothetical protein FRC10_006820, partial [Ceratobasidium sp. 414]
IHLQLPHPRTYLKKHFSISVPFRYGLKLEEVPTNAACSAELWNKNNFIYKKLGDPKTIFRHPAILEAIKHVFFQGNGLGTRYSEEFEQMPVATIALACTILRHVIGKFRHGEYRSENLNNGTSLGFYRGYVALMDQMARDTRTRLNNIMLKLGKKCLASLPSGQGPPELVYVEIDLGSDSQEETDMEQSDSE